MRRTTCLCLLLAVWALPLCAADQNADLPVLKTKVKTLAAFKNGLGFVFRAGTTELKDGWAAMDQIPRATLGTLWIGTTSAAGPVQEVVSFKSKTATEWDAVNIAELLAANVGKPVTIIYSPAGTAQPITLEAVILSVPEDRKPDDPTVVNLGSSRSSSVVPGQIVLLKTDRGGILAINKGSIVSAQFPDSSNLKTKIEKDVNSAKVRVGGKPKSAEITLAYLEKGLLWSPSYLVNIKDEKKADITLEAVLANDAEDLEDVDVSFVVGYPNFAFADSLTPLSLQQSVTQFVQALTQTGGRPYGGFAGAMTQQSIAYNTADYLYSERWSPESAYSANKPMAGESNEDLYFYHQEHVTIKKGDRARYTVFSDGVPYEHIYQWSIPDSMSVDDRGYRQDSSRRVEDLDQVWHALKIENTTKQPWTTAPALTVNGSMPVAQDMLKYTPPGGKNTLKLTVATDVRAEQEQTEASRKVTRIANDDFDEVTVDGKLTIKNYKQKAIKANVLKSVLGEVLQSGQEGKVRKVVKRVTAVNPTSEIEWEFGLEPGQEKALTYQYKVLVRR